MAFLIAAVALPGVSFAQTQSVADMQAELQQLLAQVAALESQLSAQGVGSWCYTFSRNLSIGMSGADVNALQNALVRVGETVQATGTFDDQTAAAVTAFQEKYASEILSPYGLSNGTGYAGKATRAKLNALFGCTGGNPITVSTSTQTPTSPVSVCPAWGCNGPEPIRPPITVASTTPTPSTQAFTIQNDSVYSPLTGVSVSTGVTLMVLDISNTSNDPIKITGIGATQAVLSSSGSQISALSPDFNNISLREVVGTQATNVGIFSAFTNGGSSWISNFYPSGLTIPANTTERFLVVADVTSPSADSGIVGTQGQIAVSAQGITAIDTVTNTAVTGSGTALANIAIIGSQTSTAPTTPTVSQVQSLTAIASGNTVTLNWQPAAASDNGTVIYNVYRTFTTTPCTSNSPGIAQPHGTSYTDLPLPAGTYYYCVQSMDTNGGYLGPVSAQASATIAPATAAVAQPITIKIDPSTFAAGQIQTGSTGNSLLIFDVTNPNNDPVKVTALHANTGYYVSSTITLSGGAGSGGVEEYNNVTLYDITGGSRVPVGTFPAFTLTTSGISLGYNSIVYPQNMVIAPGAIEKYLVTGDVASFNALPAVVGSSVQMGIIGNSVTTPTGVVETVPGTAAIDTVTNAVVGASGYALGGNMAIVQGQ